MDHTLGHPKAPSSETSHKSWTSRRHWEAPVAIGTMSTANGGVLDRLQLPDVLTAAVDVDLLTYSIL